MIMTREEAIELLKLQISNAEFYARYTNNDKDAEKELKDAEAFRIAIEALSVEAIQGKWVRCEREIKDLEGNILCHVYWYECNQCGSKPPRKNFEKQEWLSDFCPNCGAKMSKGGGDNEVD